MPGASAPVDVVGDRQYRVTEQHPWPCETHDLPGQFTLLGFVTVNRAVGAGRFVFAIGTFVEPDFRVIKEAIAAVAQRAVGPVVGPAVDTDHLAHGQEFAVQMIHAGLSLLYLAR